MQKDSFVFHKEWRDAISGLSSEIRLEVYEAIIEYGLSGTLTSSLRPMTMLAFNFAKAILDRDAEKESNIKRKRSEAGKKGGARKGNQNASKTSKNKQKQANQANACFEDIPPTPPIEEYIDSNESLSTNVDLTLYVPTCDDIVKFYNNTIKSTTGCKLPACIKLTDKRKQIISARLQEYSIQQVYEAINKTATSRFCNGQGSNGWVANIDFIFNVNNMPKILEGKYDNRPAEQTTQLKDNSPDKFKKGFSW